MHFTHNYTNLIIHHHLWLAKQQLVIFCLHFALLITVIICYTKQKEVGMGNSALNFWIIIDFVAIAAGIFCIVAPDKAYNFGRKEQADIPKNWHITSRIVGAVCIVIGIVFIILDFS